MKITAMIDDMWIYFKTSKC